MCMIWTPILFPMLSIYLSKKKNKTKQNKTKQKKKKIIQCSRLVLDSPLLRGAQCGGGE